LSFSALLVGLLSLELLVFESRRARRIFSFFFANRRQCAVQRRDIAPTCFPSALAVDCVSPLAREIIFFLFRCFLGCRLTLAQKVLRDEHRRNAGKHSRPGVNDSTSESENLIFFTPSRARDAGCFSPRRTRTAAASRSSHRRNQTETTVSVTATMCGKERATTDTDRSTRRGPCHDARCMSTLLRAHRVDCAATAPPRPAHQSETVKRDRSKVAERTGPLTAQLTDRSNQQPGISSWEE
jgi:hypothetical protein